MDEHFAKSCILLKWSWEDSCSFNSVWDNCEAIITAPSYHHVSTPKAFSDVPAVPATLSLDFWGQVGQKEMQPFYFTVIIREFPTCWSRNDCQEKLRPKASFICWHVQCIEYTWNAFIFCLAAVKLNRIKIKKAKTSISGKPVMNSS